MELVIKKVSFYGRIMATDSPFRSKKTWQTVMLPGMTYSGDWVPACAGIRFANELHELHECLVFGTL